MAAGGRVKRARIDLIAARSAGSGWGDRPGGPPRGEPTALACLALRASADVAPEGTAGLLTEATGWLAARHRPDGAIAMAGDLPEVTWATPQAILAMWADPACGATARAAVGWLLGQAGDATPVDAASSKILGHNPTLVGWPWVDGTHSWLEPTAWAVLALGRAGRGEHPRAAEGLALIADRAISTGGWNYGNRSVFGVALRPHPGPTGLALLALSRTGRRTPAVARGLDYLRSALPGVTAGQSLGLGLLGLRAWGELPSAADAWLDASHRVGSARPASATRLACLLLAEGSRSLEWLGLRPAAGGI